MPNDNPLSTLSAEQLTALLDTLRKQVQPRPLRPVVEQPAPELVYYKVSDGTFETVVDGRDVADKHIEDVAMLPLQAWYMRRDIAETVEIEFEIEEITHNQYVDWLRR